MATYYLNSAGSNTAPYDTWAKAATTLTAAIAAATADGDIILAHKVHTEEVAVDTTYTPLAHISIVCVDKDASNVLATMGTAAWIGNSTVNRSVTFSSQKRVYMNGLTLRTAGASADQLHIGLQDQTHYELENCYLWQGNTQTSSHLKLGPQGTAVNSYVRLRGCTFRLGATAQSISCSGSVDIEGGSLSADGASPVSLFRGPMESHGGTWCNVVGFDMSHCTGNVIGDITGNSMEWRLYGCKLGTGFTLAAAQTSNGKSGGRVFVQDCHSGDTHGIFGYADGLGSVVSDTGLYFTSGYAGQSWKIVTTANASTNAPFITPWLHRYHDATTSVTPYLEVLRDGSATAFTDAEVWGDFSAKVTTGSTLASLFTDRMAPLGAPAAQAAGAGLASWTGEGGTAWSGKVGAGAALTPAEAGYIRARVCVGLASATVYVDPQIRV